MYSFLYRQKHYLPESIKLDFAEEDIHTTIERKIGLGKTISLSIGILAIIAFLPIRVRAHLASKGFPIVISEISTPQVVEQPVRTPFPQSGDSDRPQYPIPTPTISPSVPHKPEDIPDSPQESPEFTPPEDIQPSKPTPDVPDDIPRPVPSHNLPSSSPENSSSGNLLEVAAASDSLNIFARAIETAGLTDTLIEDSFTIFAPTNEAFSASLPPGAVEFLLQSENKSLLQKLIRYHIVKGEIAAKELTTGKLNTLGGSIAIRVTPKRIILNNSSITNPDIRATNGVIHSINRVLIPRHLRNAITTKMSGKSDVKQR